MDNSEVRKLLEEAQVAVALAATLSNPEWMDLWKKIQDYLDQNPANQNEKKEN